LKGVLKGPLLLAAIGVVLRVILERVGAPHMVSAFISIAVLHTLLAPLYFAVRIGRSGIPSPYFTQVKLVAIFVVLARAMIIPTYWLARIYGWNEPRFAGLSPDESNAIIGFVAIPFLTAGFWIAGSIVFGGALGMIVIAIMRGRRGNTPNKNAV